MIVRSKIIGAGLLSLAVTLGACSDQHSPTSQSTSSQSPTSSPVPPAAAPDRASAERTAFLEHVRPLGLAFDDDASLLSDGDSVCNDQTPLEKSGPVPMQLDINMLEAPPGGMTEDQAKGFIDAATRYLCPPGSVWV